jgi:hypothetical protein
VIKYGAYLDLALTLAQVIKEGSVKKETKSAGGGWFSSWFGGGSSQQNKETEKPGTVQTFCFGLYCGLKNLC